MNAPVPSRPGRRLPAVVSSLALALVLCLAGCGEDSAPADAVPALSQHLDEVDAAVAEGRFDDARAALDAVVDVTARARVEGALDSDEADAILAAVGGLAKQLPADQGKRPAAEAATGEPSAPASAAPAPEKPASQAPAPEVPTAVVAPGGGGGPAATRDKGAKRVKGPAAKPPKGAQHGKGQGKARGKARGHGKGKGGPR